ncbi:MAG: peptidylprolyl isomerase [Gemmatimonadota bacterium]|nr:MAG: peptidylprolyl isomerase [Gemmatimonadota bacterium]
MLNQLRFSAVILLPAFTIILSSCSQKQIHTGRPGTEDQTPATTAEQKEKTAAELNEREVAVIETELGTIVFGFYDKAAPQHTANFKKLAREGFYDGTTFHRVIPKFVIQGGSPGSKDDDRSNDGIGGPGYTIEAEFGVKHTRGAVAAARQGDDVNPEKRSNGSQFYICMRDIPHLDSAGYSVFGQVIEGMEVAEKIVSVDRDGNDNPLQRVEMKVTIEAR